jgi:hypothetical protein
MEARIKIMKRPQWRLIGALEDWSGDQQSAVGYWNPLQRSIQDDVV